MSDLMTDLQIAAELQRKAQLLRPPEMKPAKPVANADIAEIIKRRTAEAQEREANRPPPPKLEDVTAFYRRRMIALGYDDREPDCHHKIAQWCARRFLGIEDRGLLLYGENGTGKTKAALLIKRFFDIKFVWAPDVVAWWRNDKEIPWLEKTLPSTGSGLIIDELGKDLETGQTDPKTKQPIIEMPRQFGERFNVLGHLLAMRYDQWRQSGKKALTIITTNCDDDMIERYYGKHILDRFSEMFRRVAFVGKSRRSDWKRETPF